MNTNAHWFGGDPARDQAQRCSLSQTAVPDVGLGMLMANYLEHLIEKVAMKNGVHWQACRSWPGRTK